MSEEERLQKLCGSIDYRIRELKYVIGTLERMTTGNLGHSRLSARFDIQRVIKGLEKAKARALAAPPAGAQLQGREADIEMASQVAVYLGDVPTCEWSVMANGSFRCTLPEGHNGLHRVYFGSAEHLATPAAGERGAVVEEGTHG